MARQAMEGNSIQAMRIALQALYAIQYQTQAQRQRQIGKAPVYRPCASCGKRVAIWRRPRLGEPVYCRRPSTCRTRAFRARQARQAMAPGTGTTSQVPEPARESAGQRPYEPSPADIWLAARAG